MPSAPWAYNCQMPPSCSHRAASSRSMRTSSRPSTSVDERWLLSASSKSRAPWACQRHGA